jgi:inosine/xanthosine triphosphatase
MTSAKRTLVAVGSTNPAKVKGTRLAFGRALGLRTTTIKAVKTIPFVGSQPLSLEETVEGAQERAMFALESARTDFGVGVEAGLVELGRSWPGHCLNLQVAAIVDATGRLSFGCSSGFPIPAEFVEKLKQDRQELDRYTHQLAGAKKVREEEGIVYHLSKKRLSRVEMTEQCVSMALIPWLNRKLYGFS